jgi:hypothetical protein
MVADNIFISPNPRNLGRDSSSSKSEFRMTKTPSKCHSERSEESHALIGRIQNEGQ